jgi:photosystem II stability/assembly factor-like uncharacterized protein
MRHKLQSIVLCILLAIVASCDDDENSRVQWEIIEFPGEVVIHAIYGDLNEYMVVSTISKILRTVDGDETWTTVKTVTDPIASFNSLNGDLYAVSNFTDYISHDQGQTWEPVTFNHEVNPPWYHFNDTKGFLYQVVGHFDGELALPTSFLRSINKGDSWENIFPYKRGISSWHIDANDKVYLGTSHPIWDGKFFNEDPQLTAHLYYMK